MGWVETVNQERRDANSGGDADKPQGASAPGSMSRRAWLERLLTDSLVEDGSTGDLSDSDLVGSLIEVAARHRGQPFSLDPVAVEMVLATLTTRFRAGGMAV
jgi:hypothetical protein